MAKYSDIVLKRGYFTEGIPPTEIDVAGALDALVALWSSPASGPSRAKAAIMNLARRGEAGVSMLFAMRQMISRRRWQTKEIKTKAAHQELSVAISRFVRKK